MSDQSQGEGWWVASDGRWYPPESHPDHGTSAAEAATSSVAAAPTVTAPAGGTAGPGPGMATAAMVCGIVGVCLFWTVIGGVILGILGIVFGVVGRARVEVRQRALSGIVLGIVGIVGSLWFLAAATDDPAPDGTTRVDDFYCDTVLGMYSGNASAAAAGESPSTAERCGDQWGL